MPKINISARKTKMSVKSSSLLKERDGPNILNASHGLSDNLFILQLQGNLCFGPHDDTHMTNDGSLGPNHLLALLFNTFVHI